MKGKHIARSLGGRWGSYSGIAPCPAHDDTAFNLIIRQVSARRVRLRCRVGCSEETIIDAMKSSGLWDEKSDKAQSNQREMIFDLCHPIFTFDQITLISTEPKNRLRQLLPVTALRHRTSKFQIRDCTSRWSQFRSIIVFNFTPDLRFWSLFEKHKADLGYYAVASIELAYDFPVASDDDAVRTLKTIIPHIRKLWHKRGSLRFQFEEHKLPPAGIINAPSWYFEDQDSTTRLKLYCRHKKTPSGFEPNSPRVRLEWTLNGVENIRAKTGIRNIATFAMGADDVSFLCFDSITFLMRYFRIEQLDIERFGQWLDPASPCPERTGYDLLRHLAAKEPQSNDDWFLAQCKWTTAAQVRGYLRSERAEVRLMTTPQTRWQRKIAEMSDYRINTFFHPLIPSFALHYVIGKL